MRQDSNLPLGCSQALPRPAHTFRCQCWLRLDRRWRRLLLRLLWLRCRHGLALQLSGLAAEEVLWRDDLAAAHWRSGGVLVVAGLLAQLGKLLAEQVLWGRRAGEQAGSEVGAQGLHERCTRVCRRGA